MFWPLDPRAEDVDINDIAHALALKCRFTGHVKEFYSVAQHSVFCSEYAAAHDAPPVVQLAAQLHDASEAYWPDVAGPIKPAVRVEYLGSTVPFSRYEKVLTRCVAEALGIPFDAFADPIIKEADLVMLMTEHRDLMGPSPAPWGIKPKMLWTTIYAQSPNQAKSFFLARYHRLKALLPEPTIVTDGTAS